MDLNDSSLFTPTITPTDNPFAFVEESALNKPGVVEMSGNETDGSGSDCSEIENASAAGFIPIDPGMK